MIFDSIYIILGYDIILLNIKYFIKYTISFRPVTTIANIILFREIILDLESL